MAITLTMFRGLPFDYNVTLRDKDQVPIDITGADGIMKIRETLDSDTVLAEISTANGRMTITDGPNGVFNILLDALTTGTIQPDTAGFDISLTVGTQTYLIAENSKIKIKLFFSRS